MRPRGSQQGMVASRRCMANGINLRASLLTKPKADWHDGSLQGTGRTSNTQWLDYLGNQFQVFPPPVIIGRWGLALAASRGPSGTATRAFVPA